MMEKDALVERLSRMHHMARIPRFHPYYRVLMLSDAIYHGLVGGGSPWRCGIDQQSGRFTPHVRR